MATLTKNYQMLSQKYLGNSYGDLYVRLYAKYTEQDVANNRTYVVYQARSYYSGNSYILDQQGTMGYSEADPESLHDSGLPGRLRRGRGNGGFGGHGRKKAGAAYGAGHGQLRG